MADPRWVFHHRLTVRFSDCDLLGHVNNAVYLTYFEECRLEWWRTFGDRPMGTAGFGVIIAHVAEVTVADNGEVEVEIAPNTRVKVIKSMLADVRTKAAPAKDAKKAAPAEE